MSAEPKFTPGPWRWHDCGGYHYLCNDTNTEPGEFPSGIIHSDGSACGEYSPDIDVCGPDAHLIAAAPDLHDAAAHVLECWGASDDDYCRADMETAIEELRAALTKAQESRATE